MFVYFTPVHTVTSAASFNYFVSTLLYYSCNSGYTQAVHRNLGK